LTSKVPITHHNHSYGKNTRPVPPVEPARSEKVAEKKSNSILIGQQNRQTQAIHRPGAI